MSEDIQLETLRHSASHILAAAVKKIYPQVKLAIGPSIEDGFYYDFDFAEPISDKDLPAIEKAMKKIIGQNAPFERLEMSKAEAKKLLTEQGENYKLELLDDLEDGTITFYKSGDFIDLCAGPHVEKPSVIKGIKLLKVAGAYWRGSEKNKMLTRIYGTAFATKEELDAYLFRIAEAEKRDHRKLGKELNLFSMHDEAPGNPFFHNDGMVVYNKLIDFARGENGKRGYKEIMTPLILNEDLWHKSGHWDNYQENMYFTQIDEKPFAVKPMNCPGGLLVYKNDKHSYRDLPIRMGEFGRVHRHEKSGVLHGLFRVRTFVQDDAHIFCTEEQLKNEVKGVVEHILYFYKVFGFTDVAVELSTKPEKAIGSQEVWDKAENYLKEALVELGINYKLNPGDGAFYGPKIDFHIKDCLGRSWQCGTIQVDFSMPERFDLTYTSSADTPERPVMIHRAIYGSIERFMGILIEHFAGKFPLWLAPLQIKLLTIADAHVDFANEVKTKLQKHGISVEVDDRAERIGYKIRETQIAKIPYMAVIGDEELKSGSLSLRKRDDGDLGSFTVEEVIDKLLQEIAAKQ